MGITDIPPSNPNDVWASVSGNVDTANVWSNLTTFGAFTDTTGGKLKRPAGMKSINGMIATAVHDHTGTTAGIAGVRFRDGVTPSAQYMMTNLWGGQTTVSVGALVAPMLLNPDMQTIANVGIDASPGVSDLGAGDATVSIRWSPNPPKANLYWLAAVADSTAATDTLSNALTAYGGDVTFPVDATGVGIRALGIAQSSDMAAAGGTIGQYQFQGVGLVNNPQKLAGGGAGSEAGATTGVAGVATYFDSALAIKLGSEISLLAGYTGTDSGTESLGMGLAFQMGASGAVTT